MKKILLNISSLLTAVITISMFIACSSDDNLDNKRSEDSKQQLTFTLTDEDFNADEEVSVTRAGKQSLEVAKDTIDLGNDIFAETTLERDTARDVKPATRAAGMSNGTYTILAYQSGVLKGTLKGTVTSNVFAATSANQSLSLDPGTYTFYCCNDKVNISGNNLTVNRADAGTARIGVTTKTIPATPAKQKVDFVMKHVGARVRIKVSGYMPIRNSKALLKSKNNIPGTLTLDAATGLFTGDNSFPAGSPLDNSGAREFSSSHRDGGIATFGVSKTFDALQSDYYYILPETNLKSLMAEFPTLNIYNKSVSNAAFTLDSHFNGTAKQNKSYVLRITLMYRYKVLYSDGTTALMNSKWTGHGTPIGIVINDNNGTPHSGTAIALGNAMNNVSGTNMPPIQNTVLFTRNNSLTDKQGYHWTWDASGSDGGAIKGDDYRLSDLKGYLSSVLTGTNLSKFYIPAVGEWKEAMEKVFFGDIDPYFLKGTIYMDWFDVATFRLGGLAVSGSNGSYFPLGNLLYMSTQGGGSSPSYGVNWYKIKIFGDGSMRYGLDILPSEDEGQPANIRPFIHF